MINALEKPTVNPTPEGATTMTKLVIAAVAALSLLSSPVLAGPASWSPAQSSDFQLQGR